MNRRHCRISKGGEATHSNANIKKELQGNETKNTRTNGDARANKQANTCHGNHQQQQTATPKHEASVRTWKLLTRSIEHNVSKNKHVSNIKEKEKKKKKLE